MTPGWHLRSMPRLFPLQPRQPSRRLPGCVYVRCGSYFVTTVVKNRSDVLSIVDGGNVSLTDVGHVAEDALDAALERLSTIAVDSRVIMPDHVHLIVGMSINNTYPLGQFVNAFKGLSARRINALWNCTGHFWQRGFHDRIIRNAAELAAYRRYVVNNPRRWTAEHSGPLADM